MGLDSVAKNILEEASPEMLADVDELKFPGDSVDTGLDGMAKKILEEDSPEMFADVDQLKFPGD